MRSLIPTFLSCVLVGLFAAPSAAQNEPGTRAEPVPRPVPKIVMYTMGKGVVVWQKFGHGAICAEYEPGSGMRSLCYNYGTTDFTKPLDVGWGFLRGEGEFWVSVTTPARMIKRYIGFDRTLWRQEIPLPDDKARLLANRLAVNALPENRNYTYHHYYDNCTTRIRDLLDEATDGQLRAGTEGKPGPTFREFSRIGFSEDEWLLVATDFFLGRGADKRPDLWEAMFLPDYLRSVVHDRLGAEPVVIYQRRGPPLTEGTSSGRMWVVLFALLLAIPLVVARWRGRFERLALGWAAVVLFLVGFIVWFLALVTAVEEFRYNENLFIFLPTDLALLFLGPTRRTLYARIRVVMVVLASLLFAVGVFTQPLWSQWLIVFLPMILLAVPARTAAAVVVAGTGEAAAPAGAGQKTSGKTSGQTSGQTSGHTQRSGGGQRKKKGNKKKKRR